MKIMLAFTVGWMFVIIYYLPRVTDDGNKVKNQVWTAVSPVTLFVYEFNRLMNKIV